MGTFCNSAVFYEPKTTLNYKVNFKNPSDLASLPQLLKVLYCHPSAAKTTVGSLCTASLYRCSFIFSALRPLSGHTGFFQV